jgi:hypothetical protein
MVKTNGDCLKKAPRCQRILSIPPQISFDPGEIVDAGGKLFSGAAFCEKKLLALPLADPSAPPVISKREKSPARLARAKRRSNDGPANVGFHLEDIKAEPGEVIR